MSGDFTKKIEISFSYSYREMQVDVGTTQPHSLQLLLKTRYNFHHVNECVDVEHENKSLDY